MDALGCASILEARGEELGGVVRTNRWFRQTVLGYRLVENQRLMRECKYTNII